MMKIVDHTRGKEFTVGQCCQGDVIEVDGVTGILCSRYATAPKMGLVFYLLNLEGCALTEVALGKLVSRRIPKEQVTIELGIAQ